MSTEKLDSLLKDIVKEQNFVKPKVTINPISSDGANYSSSLYTITVTESGKEDLHLFAKILLIKQDIPLPIDMVDIEQLFYRELLKKYEDIQNAHNVPSTKRLVVPKFYGCNPFEPYAETIVLENLAAKGYTTYDRFKPIDWDYATKAIDSLAKFHALSVAYSEEYPEEFKQLAEKIKGTSDMMTGIIQHMYQQRIDTTLSVTSEKHKNKLKKYLETEVRIESMFKTKLQGPFLCHGDYRASNLMHKVNEDGSLEVIPIDFQTIKVGSPLVDLFYLIFTGTDKKFRRQHFQDLTDYYYQELSNALRSFNLDPDVIYPKRAFDLELKEHLPYALVTAIYTLPIITVESQDAPTVGFENGVEGFDGFLKAKTGSLYPERMNGVINDFFRWGIIE
ncbi:uncharacterized protein LOC131842072 [Achroia grisella]|uniref:uncharacterized protein LOC131842072 n=1 Tax=Achroia grisella TaxID=688607 RepID=UPI0027D1FE9B|nr:uncharacterized protein LOC131842072 [Achroia grisella]